MHSIILLWLAALFSLTNHSTAGQAQLLTQQGTTISGEAYWELVRDTRQAVLQMKSESAAEIRRRLDDLALQWEQVRAVELEDHSLVEIDPAYLVVKLRADPPDLEPLARSLEILLNAHQEFPQKVFTLQDIQPLQEILARPEFQWSQGQTLEMPAWLGRLFDAIADFTDRVAFVIVNAVYQGRLLLTIAGAILFALVIFYISRSLSRSLAGNSRLAEEAEAGEGILTSKSALQRAQSLSTQGDYRNAVRYLYLSSLLVLDEQGLLRYDRSRTNREYLKSVASRPGLANPLRDVIDVFDRVWYGYEPVDEETYRAYKDHVQELREKKE